MSGDRAIEDDQSGALASGRCCSKGVPCSELAALLAAYPFLRQAPRGNGQPVLMLPAFMTSDFSTRALRGFLRDRGCAVHGWKLGRNTGPTPETVAALVQRLHELRGRYDGDKAQ